MGYLARVVDGQVRTGWNRSLGKESYNELEILRGLHISWLGRKRHAQHFGGLVVMDRGFFQIVIVKLEQELGLPDKLVLAVDFEKGDPFVTPGVFCGARH